MPEDAAPPSGSPEQPGQPQDGHQGEPGQPQGGHQNERGQPEDGQQGEPGQPQGGHQDEPQAGQNGRTDDEAWNLPWAEPFVAGRPERARLAAAFGSATRRTGSLWQLMGQAAADRIGLNATDLNCLNILSFSREMTAGELARATGLTTASITGVVDRLEQAGFVRRQRDPKDRRRVVIRLELHKALQEVAPVFQPMIRDWLAMTNDYSDDELRLIVEFYGRMEQVIRKHLIRLRGPADPGGQPA
jgi:DNA-binding MarR family transcriptional regulator